MHTSLISPPHHWHPQVIINLLLMHTFIDVPITIDTETAIYILITPTFINVSATTGIQVVHLFPHPLPLAQLGSLHFLLLLVVVPQETLPKVWIRLWLCVLLFKYLSLWFLQRCVCECVCMCMCVCICMCMCVCMCVDMCVSACVNVVHMCEV